jgi:hypothetical protein
MRTPNKTLIALATAAAVVGPMVPKTVTVNINESPKPIVISETKTCNIVSMIIDDKGKRFCEYRCGSKMILQPATDSYCESIIKDNKDY